MDTGNITQNVPAAQSGMVFGDLIASKEAPLKPAATKPPLSPLFPLTATAERIFRRDSDADRAIAHSAVKPLLERPKALFAPKPTEYETSYTLVESATPMAKTLTVDAFGRMVKTSTSKMSRGVAQRVKLGGTPEQILTSLGANLERVTTKQAIITAPPTGDETNIRIVMSHEVRANPGTIARTKEFFKPLNGTAILGMDFDTSDFTPALLRRLHQVGGIGNALAEVHPAFASAAVLRRNSSSAAATLRGSDAQISGFHCYYLVNDAEDAQSRLGILAMRLMLAGYIWPRITGNGNIQPRTLFDETASGDACRLFYEALPVINDERISFVPGAMIPTVGGGGLLDLSGLKPLDELEKAELERVMAQLRADHAERAAVVRKKYEAEQIARMVAKGTNADLAKKIVTRAVETQVLCSDFPIAMDDGRVVTIAEILANPRAFHNKTCGDPNEPEYGAGKAQIYSDQLEPYINSFAHGGAKYRLQRDWFEENEATTSSPSETAVPTASAVEPFDLFSQDDPTEFGIVPEGILPPLLYRRVISEARSKGVPEVFALMAAVPVIGAAIGAELRLKVYQHNDKWVEHPHLWVVLIAPPGSAKSPTLDSAIDPLVKLDVKWRMQNSVARREWDAASKLSKKDKTASAPPAPVYRHAVIRDITAEEKYPVFAANPRGLLQYTDELQSFFGQMGAYKKSIGAERGQLLSSFDGKSYSLDRRGQEPVFAEKTCLATVEGVQPDSLRKLVANLGEDGLLQRFIFVSHDEVIRKPIDEAPDHEADENYHGMITKLATAEYHFPPLLQMTAEGYAAFSRQLDEINKLQHLPGVSPRFKEHIAKWGKLLARLLLTLHGAEQYEAAGKIDPSAEISIGTVGRAAALARFLLRHAIRFYREYYAASEVQSDTQWVAEYLLAHPEKVVLNRRDLGRANDRFLGQENTEGFRRLNDIMAELEQLHWCEVESQGVRGPKAWKVNAAIHARFLAQAERVKVKRKLQQENIREAALARKRINADISDKPYKDSMTEPTGVFQ